MIHTFAVIKKTKRGHPTGIPSFNRTVQNGFEILIFGNNIDDNRAIIEAFFREFVFKR